MTTLYRGREIILSLDLGMKLSDIEFQSDNTKATFYYSADDRVDFRELIKSLASEFRIRVEMKQISLRQEAARVGGIGSCGRELCCTTWMSDFKSVSTSAARYRNLSLNPLKLSGQCGRLKCCLNYELDTYLVELKDIPKVDRGLKTEDGEATHFKTDIFNKMMWFGYRGDSNWHAVPVARVKEILELNKNGEKPLSLLLDDAEEVEEIAVNQDLLQLDKKYSKGKQKGKGRQNKPNIQNRKSNSSNPQKGKSEHRAGEDKARERRKAPINRSKTKEEPKEASSNRPESKNKPNARANRKPNDRKKGNDRQIGAETTEKTDTNNPKLNKRPNPRREDTQRSPRGKESQAKSTEEGKESVSSTPKRRPVKKEREQPKIEVHKDSVTKKRPARSKVKIQREGVKESGIDTPKSESKADKPKLERQNKKKDEE